MTASNQEKLAKIFPETFQVKRLCKQIQDLKQLRQKGVFEIRMSLMKNECLVFKVQMAAAALKNSKLPDHLKVPQDFKLMVRNTYPANPPRLFFMGDNMSKFGLKPFRDYMPELLSTVGDWSAKITNQQIIKSVPNFLEQCYANKVILKNNNKHPVILEYFQVDSLFSWKFSQTHPVRLIKRTSNKQGFLYIDIFSSEIVFLEDVGLQASYSICDYIKGDQIQSLRKKKNAPNIFILEIKLNYPGIVGKYAIEFSSQDNENILIGVMDCVKISQNERKNSEGDIKNTEESSESEEEPQEQSKSQKKKKARPINENAGIEEILEEILVVQSLVESKMTSENLSHFVTLLQKAIEYYSANGDKRFNLYLAKMQSILSNEMAQALLESANDEKKKKQEGQSSRIHKQQVYQSIVDLI